MRKVADAREARHRIRRLHRGERLRSALPAPGRDRTRPVAPTPQFLSTRSPICWRLAARGGWQPHHACHAGLGAGDTGPPRRGRWHRRRDLRGVRRDQQVAYRVLHVLWRLSGLAGRATVRRGRRHPTTAAAGRRPALRTSGHPSRATRRTPYGACPRRCPSAAARCRPPVSTDTDRTSADRTGPTRIRTPATNPQPGRSTPARSPDRANDTQCPDSPVRRHRDRTRRSPGVALCPTCERPVDEGRRFCGHCGTQFIGPGAGGAPLTRPVTKRDTWWTRLWNRKDRGARRAFRRSLPPLYRWRRVIITVLALLLIGGGLTLVGRSPSRSCWPATTTSGEPWSR